jgi:hypothetical protein
MSEVESAKSVSVAADQKPKNKITPVVIFFTATLLISGTVNTIGFKSQSYFYNFKHGFLQSFLMFTGQYLNLVVFNVMLMGSSSFRKSHFQSLTQEAREYKRNIHVSKLLIGFPSFFDAIASSVQNISLLLMPASVNQLLCGGSIITSCIVSKFMLGREIYRHHWLGNIFAVIGFTLVAMSSLLNEAATERYSFYGELLGIFLVAFSLILQGIQFNTEELIMIKNAVEPQRMVGMEGFLGLIWTFCWMVGLSFFNCPDEYMCDIGGYMEDPVVGLKQIFATPGLCFWCSVTVVSVMFFNMSSLNLTKRVSCIYGAFWSATRTAVVWVVSLLVGLETWDWTSSPIQFLGFIFLVMGNLTYNEIIEWKICGLNQKLTKYLAEGDGVNK